MGEHVVNVGDGGQEVMWVGAVNVIGGARDSWDSSELRVKSRGMGDASREGQR